MNNTNITSSKNNATQLKKEQVLKEYFEHVDDSLYVLSLRLAKLGGAIQKEVEDVYFNMDASIANFTDDNYNQGLSNQQFVITAANNIAFIVFIKEIGGL